MSEHRNLVDDDGATAHPEPGPPGVAGFKGLLPVDVDHERVYTTIVATYAMSGQPNSMPEAQPIHRYFETGRFERNLRLCEDIYPAMLGAWRIPAEALSFVHPEAQCWPIVGGRALLLVSSRGDLTAMLQLDLCPPSEVEEVTALLALTCWSRETMRIEDVPFPQWLSDRFPADTWSSDCPIDYARDVLQFVFPGEALLLAILAESGLAGAGPGTGIGSRLLSTVVSRGAKRTGSYQLHAPQWLNGTGETVSVHGRGVAVLAGWARPTENAFAIVAPLIVSALAVVRRARAAAFNALARARDEPVETALESSNLIAQLSDEISQIQLDLSFGVEAYIDSAIVPEYVLGSLQASLKEATGLAESLRNTSRMLDRLDSVVQGRLASLEAMVAERNDHRSRITSNLITFGSFVALPSALLLSFFGVNSSDVDSSASILDVRRYWSAYLIAFTPFVVMALVWYLRARYLHHRRRPPAAPSRSGGRRPRY
jgi:hypothetical protein